MKAVRADLLRTATGYQVRDDLDSKNYYLIILFIDL